LIFFQKQKYLLIMNLDTDFLIDFFKKYTKSDSKEEFTEQDDAAAPSGGGASMPKWADIYGLKRGKANMLGKKGEEWSTGLARNVANQIW
jgi:hypothetical protein